MPTVPCLVLSACAVATAVLGRGGCVGQGAPAHLCADAQVLALEQLAMGSGGMDVEREGSAEAFQG